LIAFIILPILIGVIYWVLPRFRMKKNDKK